VHIRGGSIIPLRTKSANTTTALRKLDFELLVAPDKEGRANGELYLDDGDSLVQQATSEIEFWFDGATNILENNGTFGYNAGVRIGNLTVLGESGPSRCLLDKKLTAGFAVNIGGIKCTPYDAEVWTPILKCGMEYKYEWFHGHSGWGPI
jgi:alpha-glucosidase